LRAVSRGEISASSRASEATTVTIGLLSKTARWAFATTVVVNDLGGWAGVGTGAKAGVGV